MTKISLIGLIHILFLGIFMNCSTGGNLFEGSGDVGNYKLKGSLRFDKSLNTYTLTGAGTNMRATNDEFFMVWQKETGDFSLAARIAFEGAGVNAHRKIGLIVRESLIGNAKERSNPEKKTLDCFTAFAMTGSCHSLLFDFSLSTRNDVVRQFEMHPLQKG